MKNQEMSGIKVLEEEIPIEVYQKMRVKCGLSAKTDEACKIGLGNSLFSLLVKQEDKVIGMGRVIGDGGCFCQVVDICVVPEKQGQGIGKIIMSSIINFIKTKLPKSCYTSLIADGDASFLYEKFGFKDTLPESRGMYMKSD